MTDDGDDLLPRLVAMFLGELDENLAILTEGIVELEQSVGRPAPAPLVHTLFRAAHSTKGAAHSAAVPDAVVAAGALEERLAALRDTDTPVSRDLVDALLGDVDGLKEVATAPRRDDTVPAVGGPDPAAGEPRTVRVSAGKLDALIGRLPELVALANAAGAGVAAGAAGRELERTANAVAEAAQELRMQRFGEICEGLPRVARDVARASGKQVDVVVAGDDIEVDRSVGAVVRDALLHLVRNAADHGIEPPDARRDQGKQSAGAVRIEAAVRDGSLEVVVADDGRGVDVGRLRAAASRIGVTAVDDRELAFAPGVSTASTLSEVSGRGVGLDAVRAGVEAIGGTVTLASAECAGTTVTLRVPRVLSTMAVLLATAAGRLFAVPALAVSRVVSVDLARLRSIENRTVIGESGLVVASLADTLGLPVAATAQRSLPALVCRTGVDEVALTVDELDGHAQAVVRPLPPRAATTRLAAGALTLAERPPATVLNLLACARRALASPRPLPAAVVVEDGGRRLRVLLAEDSFTTRTLERIILEAAGYQVLVAVDGREAWDLLQRHGADVVVSDVDMPGLDGFDLCRLVRSVPRFAEVPVILVTSLAEEEHRRRGVEAGATAYIVKSAFDQTTLVAAIEDLAR